MTVPTGTGEASDVRSRRKRTNPVLTIAIASLATVALAALVAIVRRGRLRRDTCAVELPDRAALERAADSRAANVVVARIAPRGGEGLDPGSAAALVRRTAERLRRSNGGATLFHTGDGGLAWLEAPGDEHSLEDRVDALAAAVLAPLDCGRVLDVSLSFGLATAEDAGGRERVAEASGAADIALARGERWRRRQDIGAAARTALPGELAGAIATGQLWNAYRPQRAIGSGRITAAVALPRWMHPRLGPIAPAEFVPAIVAGGRIDMLARHLLTLAVEDLACWRAEGRDIDLVVAIPGPLIRDHLFIEQAAQILLAARVPGERLTIAIEDSADAAAAPAGWRAMGVAVRVEGWDGSADRVAALGADIAVIDQRLVHTLTIDTEAAARLRAGIAEAGAASVAVAAAGVEDAATLALLAEMGCDFAEGDLIGRAMPADAIAALMTCGDQQAA